MSGKVLVLLAHHDDEVFVAPYIIARNIKDTFFVFVTYDALGCRSFESQNGLKMMGFNDVEMIKLSNKIIINDGEVLSNLENVYSEVKRIIEAKNIESVITHLYEGGHPDHDSLAIISYKLLKLNIVKHTHWLPFYNADGLFKPLFNVMKVNSLFSSNEKKYSIGLRSSFRVLRAVFQYKSQWKSFLGLFPGIFIKLAFRHNKLSVITDYKNEILVRPHEGALLNEYRFNVCWDEQLTKMRSFLSD